MKLIPVDELPGKRIRHPLQDILKGFMESDAKIVRIDDNDCDYKSAEVCYGCLRVASKRSGYGIKVSIREGKVYLIKTV